MIFCTTNVKGYNMNKDSHLQSLEIDPNRQYVLAGDISASMREADAKCAGLKRYDHMLEKFESFISEAADFDKDGVTVMLFGEHVTVFRNTKLDDIRNKLKNPNYEGFTNTHLVIDI